MYSTNSSKCGRKSSFCDVRWPSLPGNPHLIQFFAYTEGHTGDSRVELAASREPLLKLTCVKWASVLSLHAGRVTPGPLHHFLCLCNRETASAYARLFLQTTEVKLQRRALSPEALRHMDPVKFTSRKAKFSQINSDDLIFNHTPLSSPNLLLSHELLVYS